MTHFNFKVGDPSKYAHRIALKEIQKFKEDSTTKNEPKTTNGVDEDSKEELNKVKVAPSSSTNGDSK